MKQALEIFQEFCLIWYLKSKFDTSLENKVHKKESYQNMAIIKVSLPIRKATADF